MIDVSTATDLIDALRAIVRRARATQYALHNGELPASSAALLGFLHRFGEQRLGRLAEHLGVDPSAASRQVAALEQNGLLCRRPDPADGRASLLALTPAGHACLEHYRLRQAAHLAAALTDWTDEDAQLLLALLRRLLHDVRDVPFQKPALAARTPPLGT